MKIKLHSNGQIINPPLRVAQRYIRLGRAAVYKEPEPVKPKKKKPKKKKEVVVESKAAEKEEPEVAKTKVKKGRDSGDTVQYSDEVDIERDSGSGNGWES